MKSIFLDKNKKPGKEELMEALGNTFDFWENLEAFTKANYPEAAAEWHFSGEKYGWSYRIKDKKRVLVYLLPRDKFFKTALVFGMKAVNQVLESDISESIKSELEAAKQYAEGKGIRIEVKDSQVLEDIQKLIRIKITS